MAKLKARGRTEIVRMTRESNEIKKLYDDDKNPRVWARNTIALMSDRKILEKRDVRWQDGSKHSYGWKVVQTVRADVTPEQFTAFYAKQGYEVSR